MSPAALGREPSRLPQADLAGAFGPPDRSAGLAGKLTPVPVGAPLVVAPPVPPSPRTNKNAQERGQKASAASPDTSRPLVVIVYLPASLRDRLRQASVARAATYTSTVLEALDATHDRLDVLLADQRPTRRTGSLFNGSDGAMRTRPRNAEPHVQVSLRLIRGDLEVIDRLVSEQQAPNRSALIAAAVSAYLAS